MIYLFKKERERKRSRGNINEFAPSATQLLIYLFINIYVNQITTGELFRTHDTRKGSKINGHLLTFI